MEIEVSPDQIWFHPLGTTIEECRSHLAQQTTAAERLEITQDGTYDGMYVEALGIRWLASITFKDGKIHRQTLLVTSTDREDFKKIYAAVKEEFGRGVRRGLLKPTGYVWTYRTAQLILAIKEAPPLTGIMLILTAR